MIRFLSWGGLGLMLALACGADRAAAAGPFDGTYVGQQKETLNDNGGRCQNLTHDVKLTITDSVIRYQWGVPIETTVKPDGSFSDTREGLAMRGASATISLKGKITNVMLEADVGGSRCAAHLSLKKKA